MNDFQISGGERSQQNALEALKAALDTLVNSQNPSGLSRTERHQHIAARQAIIRVVTIFADLMDAPSDNPRLGEAYVLLSSGWEAVLRWTDSLRVCYRSNAAEVHWHLMTCSAGLVTILFRKDLEPARQLLRRPSTFHFITTILCEKDPQTGHYYAFGPLTRTNDTCFLTNLAFMLFDRKGDRQTCEASVERLQASRKKKAILKALAGRPQAILAGILPNVESAVTSLHTLFQLCRFMHADAELDVSLIHYEFYSHIAGALMKVTEKADPQRDEEFWNLPTILERVTKAATESARSTESLKQVVKGGLVHAALKWLVVAPRRSSAREGDAVRKICNGVFRELCPFLSNAPVYEALKKDFPLRLLKQAREYSEEARSACMAFYETFIKIARLELDPKLQDTAGKSLNMCSNLTVSSECFTILKRYSSLLSALHVVRSQSPRTERLEGLQQMPQRMLLLRSLSRS